MMGEETGAGAQPLPEYDAQHLSGLDAAALVELLAQDEDRAPRALIDECARRGEPMMDRLEALLAEARAWGEDASPGEWWRLLHAVMILGLVPGERAGLLLARYMARMEEALQEDLQDWLAGYWPAFFANKPEGLLDALRALALDREVDWYMRTQAAEATLAIAERRGAAALDAAVDWAAELAADESEDWTMRLCCGGSLLDFPRERHRALLESLAARQSRPDWHFSHEDVDKAYLAMEDRPPWRERDDPWAFYRPEAIAERQARWAREEAEGADVDDSDVDDSDFEDDDIDDVDEEVQLPYVRATPKVGRNDPCPCGSGKKYKKCCLGKATG